MDSAENKLPLKNYGLARLFSYITLVCFIIMFFLPIIRIESEDDGIKAIASISPYQLIMGDIYTIPKIVFLDKEDESELLEALIRESIGSVEMIDSMFPGLRKAYPDGEYISLIRWIMLGLGIFIGFISALSMSAIQKRFGRTSKNNSAGSMSMDNLTYITLTYCQLPTVLEFLKGFLFCVMMIPVVVLEFASFSYSLTKNESEWGINLVFTIAMAVILIGLNNGIVSKLILGKDCKKIKFEGARYGAPIISTFSSDMKAIKCIFSSSQPFFDDPVTVRTFAEDAQAHASVVAVDCEDALYKYKKLLDDGLITQEDYEKKKNEILFR